MNYTNQQSYDHAVITDVG